MATAFISGVNSFLGGTLAHILIGQGWEVRGLVRAESNTRLIEDLTINYVVGDLRQPSTYRHALSDCEVLFHVAALYTHQSARLRTMWEINEAGTRHILSAAIAASIPHILHTSTIGTIGQPVDGTLATEETPYNLTAPSDYVRSKLAGERIATHLARDGAPIVIVHPTAIFGAGDWRPSSSGRYILKILRNQVPAYPPGGINWCPVTDVAVGMVQAALKGEPGRHYILGHHQGNLNRDDFVTLISRATGKESPQPPETRWRHRIRQLFQRRATRQQHHEAANAPLRLTCNPTRAISELQMPQSDLLQTAVAATTWYYTNNYV